jgi:hypothetical protein
MMRDLNMSNIATSAQVLEPGSTILCRDGDLLDSGAGIISKEALLKFTPSVDVPFWPDEGIEWYLRRRKKMKDKRHTFA